MTSSHTDLYILCMHDLTTVISHSPRPPPSAALPPRLQRGEENPPFSIAFSTATTNAERRWPCSLHRGWQLLHLLPKPKPKPEPPITHPPHPCPPQSHPPPTLQTTHSQSHTQTQTHTHTTYTTLCPLCTQTFTIYNHTPQQSTRAILEHRLLFDIYGPLTPTPYWDAREREWELLFVVDEGYVDAKEVERSAWWRGLEEGGLFDFGREGCVFEEGEDGFGGQEGERKGKEGGEEIGCCSGNSRDVGVGDVEVGRGEVDPNKELPDLAGGMREHVGGAAGEKKARAYEEVVWF